VPLESAIPILPGLSQALAPVYNRAWVPVDGAGSVDLAAGQVSQIYRLFCYSPALYQVQSQALLLVLLAPCRASPSTSYNSLPSAGPVCPRLVCQYWPRFTTGTSSSGSPSTGPSVCRCAPGISQVIYLVPALSPASPNTAPDGSGTFPESSPSAVPVVLPARLLVLARELTTKQASRSTSFLRALLLVYSSAIPSTSQVFSLASPSVAFPR
jgi:hypothetical protein